jgi:YidC/Oxa1 family membrane protein insertase
MSFLSLLYTLIISPLELLFEVIFTIANRAIGNEGLSIIFLSLAVNFLVLPLYKRADELQAEERDIQARMASRIRHIKKTFKGDERFFMLQEYYRINHYKPVYALKSSVSLLLQIPFFIAAYNLLSGMQCLHGMQFGFISDLGKEDAMFYIGSFPVNILPILMTLINIVSGIIYTKGHPLKAKIQVYGLAAVFLVLLYHSPSGLVFYWLLNNVFSLVKNVFYKLKDPKKALFIVLAAAGVVLGIFTVIDPDFGIKRKILLSVCGLLLCLPLASVFLKKKISIPVKAKAETKDTTTVFTVGCIFMALLTGLLIPSSVINASVLEFIDVNLPSNPVLYIINAMLLSFGSWVLWGRVFYFFMSDRIKSLFSKAVWIMCGVSIIDYMLFGTNLGILSSTLQYDIKPEFQSKEYLLNFAAIAVAAAVLVFLNIKASKIIKSILIVASLSVFAIGIYHIVGINRNYGSYKLSVDEYQNDTVVSDNEQIIPLSKNGKNVVVLMLDRAMGTQAPYIFNEKPELIEKFDGFTYYSNTISYGAYTNFGSPALYGGYEYTPERMNERDNESLESKHNEALRVMPVIFGENGYEVTVCDPTYAGYNWIPDLSIYNDHPEFHCYNLNGRFSLFDDDTFDAYSLSLSERVREIRNRNFFCFSIMKIAPLFIQETLYDDGMYNESSSGDQGLFVQSREGLSRSTGYNMYFIDAYSVLAALPDITGISDSSENTFLMMSNDTTHSPCLLQEPDYTPAVSVDNTAYDADMVSRYTIDGKTMQMETEDQITAYHVNIASYAVLGEWFDYLRENGVYDNTRIIIVSDHGRDLHQFDITCNDEDMEFFMPLLMVKDFDAKGFTVCDDFMTNGDTPFIATSGLIDDPVNPFTGNPFTSDPKMGPQTIFMSNIINTGLNNGNTFLPGSWYNFNGGDIHDPDNWSYIGSD